jgi:ABC-2 type transport system permease protein
MKKLGQIYLTQFRLFTRDVPTLVVTLILPLILGLFFSLIFSTSQQQGGNLSLTLVDHDGQRETRYMIEEMIKEAGENGLKISLKKETEALNLLRTGKTHAVLFFPEGTSESIIGYEEIEIPVYYDSNQMLSGIARLIIQNILVEINLRLSQADRVLVSREIPVVSKKNAEQSIVGLGQFYLPNFLAISFLWFSLFATAIPLVKEREEKIHLRIGITPLSPTLFIIGTILWRLTLGVINSALFLIMGVFTIKLAVFQNFPLFITAIIIGNLTFIALGYMIAAVSKKIQQAEIIAQLCNFIMMFLSGVFFTSGMLPEIVEKISYVIPLTYLGDMFRQIMVNYQGIVPLWFDLAVLTGSGLLFTGIAVKNWRWQ